jgi:dihydroneopterin aldolase
VSAEDAGKLKANPINPMNPMNPTNATNPSKDKIILTGIQFYGHHGAQEEEQILGQRFRVDVELSLDLRPAGTADALALTVDYADVVKRVTDIGQTRRFRLLEALAEAMAADLLERYNIHEVRVRVVKCAPPIPEPVEAVGVEVVRRRLP